MQNRYPYRVVLADDHAEFRHVLKQILRERNDLEVSGEAGDGLELLKLLSLLPLAPDMAIIDISMPNLGGIGATSKIKTAYPGMKILILSMHREKAYIHKVISAGADGYLFKEDAGTELFPAIEKIRQNGVYLSPDRSESDRA